MPRAIELVLADLLEAIEGVQQSVRDRTFDEFKSSWLLKHGIEIISEASRNIPENLRALTPSLSWSDIIGIGSVLRHEYHRVSDLAIWNTATRDLEPLREAILRIRASLRP